jgi:hypothetical protein
MKMSKDSRYKAVVVINAKLKVKAKVIERSGCSLQLDEVLDILDIEDAGDMTELVEIIYD